MRSLLLPLLSILLLLPTYAKPLAKIKVSEDGTRFVQGCSQEPFVIWGVNYDHDESGRLLDEYWIEDWDTVVEDFQEIQALGANCVRIHLQVGKFMTSATEVKETELTQLGRLLKLAEETGIYLNITGLACYHKKNVPDWYDALKESDRWEVQARFWQAIAKTCSGSSAVFCYDLMNEPILPGKKVEKDWLAGEFGGKHFVQRIALDLQGRSREEVAETWVNHLVDAIREEDEESMITVGVIPWVFAFGGGKPLFYSPKVSQRLDFVSVHFYPESKKVDAALKALKAYEIGKPLVIEEMFPLKCGIEALEDFVQRSASHTDGWISFYWGKTADELRAKKDKTIGDAIKASWLDSFQKLGPKMRK